MLLPLLYVLLVDPDQWAPEQWQKWWLGEPADLGITLTHYAFVHHYFLGFYAGTPMVRTLSKFRSGLGCFASLALFLGFSYAVNRIRLQSSRSNEWWDITSPFYLQTGHNWLDRRSFLPNFHEAHRWTRLVLLGLNLIHTVTAVAFFSCLPNWINLTLPGPAQFCMYGSHMLLFPAALGGVVVHGLNLFPSLPDVLAAASQTHVLLVFVAAVGYIILFMAFVAAVYKHAGELFVAVKASLRSRTERMSA